MIKTEAELLPERFAAPRATARRLKIVHGWPDRPEEQDRQIAAIQAQGYGGVVTNIRFGGGYVEDPGRWATLRSALTKLKAAGLRLWLYDLDPLAGSIRPQPTAHDIGLELPPYGVAILRFPSIGVEK